MYFNFLELSTYFERFLDLNFLLSDRPESFTSKLKRSLFSSLI
ncbi:MULTISPECIES: hypothetical protein [unclassified Fischerella]|nr:MULTISPECIES: hypothetical protein [unclassified Fischerella]